MEPQINLSNEATMGWTEWGVLILIAAIAAWYLWRKFVVKKGCGCDSCGKAKSCGKITEKPLERH